MGTDSSSKPLEGDNLPTHRFHISRKYEAMNFCFRHSLCSTLLGQHWRTNTAQYNQGIIVVIDISIINETFYIPLVIQSLPDLTHSLHHSTSQSIPVTFQVFSSNLWPVAPRWDRDALYNAMRLKFKFHSLTTGFLSLEDLHSQTDNRCASWCWNYYLPDDQSPGLVP